MSESSGTIHIPKLASRSSRLWVAGTFVALLVAMVWVWITQPENRWAIVAFLAIEIPFVLVFVTQRFSIDAATGEVSMSRLWGAFSMSRSLAEATGLDLVSNRGGGLLLKVAPTKGRAIYIPILALTDYVEKSQPPVLLRTMADQIDQWAPAGPKRRVPPQLRKQADHLESGGSAKSSPLAALVTHGVINAAKGGGAAGAGGSMLG